MTEIPRTSTEQCMTILLHAVLDYLGLWDILRAMRVNRLWREHAINHPKYYGDLCLFERGPLDNPDLFLARLSCSKGRPISVILKQTPLPVMQEISNHLAHITVLQVDVSSADSVAAVLEHLCRPAPILHTLQLRVGYPTGGLTRAPTLPAALLARHAPALNNLSVMGFDLSSGFPAWFSTIKVLTFAGWMGDLSSVFVLPSPFGQCPHLRELHLANHATLHSDACHSSCHYAWKRMTAVSFRGFDVGYRWPAFQLPLQEVPRITVAHGDADSLLALSRTLSGSLHVTFPPLKHHGNPTEEPDLSYTAVFRSASAVGSHSRIFVADLSMAPRSISAFSMPRLADRVVRLELELDAWDPLVGSRTFGPFSALDELVLNLKADTGFTRTRAWPKLSCPKLRRIILHGKQHNPTVEIGAVAAFAYASLPAARFPLMLVADGTELAGAWSDFPKTFSHCLSRET